MGQVTTLGPNKAFKLGKKGQINCPDCNQVVIMTKLPEYLPFIQNKNGVDASIASEISDNKPFCKFCGESIPNNAVFCRICGAKQE